jgi:hypothetical protein
MLLARRARLLPTVPYLADRVEEEISIALPGQPGDEEGG